MYASTIGGTVGEVNYKANAVRRTFPVGGLAQGIAVSDDGAELYVAIESMNELQIWSLATATRDTAIALASAPFDVQLSPDGTEIWISALGPGRIYALSRATRVVLNSIDTGEAPRRMAFDRFGTTAVIADEAGFVQFIR